MTKEDFKYVKEIYNDVLIKQVMRPVELRKAANIILGKPVDDVIRIQSAKGIIWNFMQYQAKDFLKNFEDVLDLGNEDEPDYELDESKPIMNDGQPKKGWNLKKEFIDDEGNVFYKGIKITKE